VFKFISLKYSP